ncbi:MAG: hypothetical protein AAF224_11795 [Pseudomonadota bacterium]
MSLIFSAPIHSAASEAEAPIPEGIKPTTAAKGLTDASSVGAAPDDLETSPPRRKWGRAPILPKSSAEGAPLTAVIAVISALAALSLAAFIAIAVAADRWTTDLSTSMTVQIKGADATEIATRAATAKAVLDAAPGVVSADIRTPAEAARLLEPWLGEGAETYLNIPALIEVSTDAAAPPDRTALERALEGAAIDASLDDHGAWNASLASAANAGQALVFAIFLVITAAACAVAVFAARAGLAANADIVALLHLIGATDQFIAGEVQRRFFAIGLKGSLVGVGVAALATVATGLIARAGAGTGGGYLAPSVGLTPLMAAPLIIVPLAICVATAATARITVLNALKKAL